MRGQGIGRVWHPHHPAFSQPERQQVLGIQLTCRRFLAHATGILGRGGLASPLEDGSTTPASGRKVTPVGGGPEVMSTLKKGEVRVIKQINARDHERMARHQSLVL